LGQTLKICFGELLSFSCIFFVVWIAFVQLMYLIYGSHIKGYATFINSMETTFQVMLGKIDTRQTMMSNPTVTPFIIAAYNMAIVYIILNIFISIVTEAFVVVRGEAKKNPNEFDFHSHLAFKLRNFFPQKSTSENLPSQKGYKDFMSILPRRINGLINYILRVIYFYSKSFLKEKFSIFRVVFFNVILSGFSY
jgi:hypothetical protein